MKEKNSDKKEGISRRAFLRMAGSISGLFLGHHILNKNIRLATIAGLSRGKESILRLPQKENLPSENALKHTWEMHFNCKVPNFMTYEAWIRLAESFNNIISIHYNANKNQESYDDYFVSYIEKASKLCASINLDLDIYFISMEYSGRQTINDAKNYRNDVVISAMQNIGGSLGDYYNLSSQFADKVGVEALGFDLKSSGQFPLNYAGALRMLSANVTTGIMDYELSEKAEQIVSQLSEYQLLEFKLRHPQLFSSFVNLEKSRLFLDKKRNSFDNDLIDLIPELSHVLDLFFKEETQDQSFSVIGLGQTPDSWQKVNATKLWRNLFFMRAQDIDPEILKSKREDVIKEYSNQYLSDKDQAYSQLVREQIFNPKFVSFLEENGVRKDTIKKIKASLFSIDQLKASYKQALYRAQIAEAKYEFDVDYQLLTSALLTKHHLILAEQYFGKFEKQSKHETMFFAFAMSKIREASDPYFLLASKFGLDFTCDAPYAREVTLDSLKYFIDQLKSRVGNPQQNVYLLQTERLEEVLAPDDLINLSKYWAWISTVNWGNTIYLTGKKMFEELFSH